MKKIKVNPAHEAVPAGYEPGYPARLDAEEYRDLVTRPTSARVGRVLAAVGAVAAGGAATAQDAGKTREDQVLKTLREGAVDLNSSITWFERTTFELGPAPGGGKYRMVLPRVPIMFGNSYSGVFDRGEARALARRLFEAYGIKLEPDVVLKPGAGRVVLDGCDREHKLGFKIRGGPVSRSENEMGSSAKAEPKETDLTDEELAALTADGFRLHVADHNAFPVMDHDSSPSMFAYMASVVDFLNGVTDGPDIDLGAVLEGWRQRIATPQDDLALPEGTVAVKTADGWKIAMKQPGKIVMNVRHRSVSGSPAVLATGATKWRILDKPLSTSGIPTFVKIGWKLDYGAYFTNRPAKSPPEVVKVAMRLTQDRDGGAPIVVESRTNRILVPAAFDAARPFRVEIDPTPANYVLDEAVIVQVMPR